MANCITTGSIPKWLSDRRTLKILDLSRNRLIGSIPSWIDTLKKVFYLDLSSNLLTGEITKNLTQLGSLYTYEQFLWLNQHLKRPQFELLLHLPYSVDLSKNGLSGALLPELENLVRLQIMDLSCNHISGTIPPNLSSMSSLEILNLSHNNLLGKMPDSVTKLHFLSQFSVAYNQSSCWIPGGSQFSTFPNPSFEGNLGLCGEFVLPCSHDNNMPITPNATSSDEEEDKSSIMGLPFAIGAAVGFLVTITVCFLYYRQADNFDCKCFGI